MTDVELLQQIVLELSAAVKTQGLVIDSLEQRLYQLEDRQNPDPKKWALIQGAQCSI